MNILYISKLTGNLCAGPTYSIPEQVDAQSKIDNVFWVNLNNVKIARWNKSSFHNLETVNADVEKFPPPFNNPDIAVIEEVYPYLFSKIIKTLQYKRVPYVIVPRGSLSQGAQEKKKIKKCIGNIIWFNKMIEKSSAIEYLTKLEFETSSKWQTKNHIIIPNGINLPVYAPKLFSTSKIVFSFIGRLDIYHKGLDLLLNSISLKKEYLRLQNFEMNLYGQNWNDSVDKIKKYLEENSLFDLVHVHKAVYDNEKKDILSKTDVFVMTSRFEGLPMGMLEALSYGVPCLATPGTNMGAEIVQKDAGWCADGNPESISQMLKKIIDERKLLPQKSLNAYKLATQYSWDSIARKTHVEYEKIINQMSK